MVKRIRKRKVKLITAQSQRQKQGSLEPSPKRGHYGTSHIEYSENESQEPLTSHATPSTSSAAYTDNTQSTTTSPKNDDNAAQPSDDNAAQPSDDNAAQPSDDNAAQPSDDNAAQPSDDNFGQPTGDKNAQLSDNDANQPSDHDAEQMSNNETNKQAADDSTQRNDDAGTVTNETETTLRQAVKNEGNEVSEMKLTQEARGRFLSVVVTRSPEVENKLQEHLRQKYSDDEVKRIMSRKRAGIDMKGLVLKRARGGQGVIPQITVKLSSDVMMKPSTSQVDQVGKDGKEKLSQQDKVGEEIDQTVPTQENSQTHEHEAMDKPIYEDASISGVFDHIMFSMTGIDRNSEGDETDDDNESEGGSYKSGEEGDGEESDDSTLPAETASTGGRASDTSIQSSISGAVDEKPKPSGEITNEREGEDVLSTEEIGEDGSQTETELILRLVPYPSSNEETNAEEVGSVSQHSSQGGSRPPSRSASPTRIADQENAQDPVVTGNIKETDNNDVMVESQSSASAQNDHASSHITREEVQPRSLETESVNSSESAVRIAETASVEIAVKKLQLENIIEHAIRAGDIQVPSSPPVEVEEVLEHEEEVSETVHDDQITVETQVVHANEVHEHEEESSEAARDDQITVETQVLTQESQGDHNQPEAVSSEVEHQEEVSEHSPEQGSEEATEIIIHETVQPEIKGEATTTDESDEDVASDQVGSPSGTNAVPGQQVAKGEATTSEESGSNTPQVIHHISAAAFAQAIATPPPGSPLKDLADEDELRRREKCPPQCSQQ